MIQSYKGGRICEPDPGTHKLVIVTRGFVSGIVCLLGVEAFMIQAI